MGRFLNHPILQQRFLKQFGIGRSFTSTAVGTLGQSAAPDSTGQQWFELFGAEKETLEDAEVEKYISLYGSSTHFTRTRNLRSDFFGGGHRYEVWRPLVTRSVRWRTGTHWNSQSSTSTGLQRSTDRSSVFARAIPQGQLPRVVLVAGGVGR